ncbi:cation diffusion facilitator family transporter [Sutcliffiella rhizosphaerae]|uniref:Manganese efflux system protein MneS n=1 Tax=Sutcliffiella rhizosphaerae TaxID=2880967 RepID=A0ABN8A490_9BACI|nr:cation diffusion facilitator family transporter [Sutcliffiella rhizosphaerae]CAG9619955.1 Manganese efflux system protein MneS [Sutcliffiella rhizosphaerae]
MEEQRYSNLKLGERGAILSIIAYVILSALKLIIASISGSEALRADGLNNTTDILASIAVLVGLRMSQKPADADHPYGHWKSEMIASLIASFIMFGIGFQVLYSAFQSMINGVTEAPDMIAAWTGIFSAVVMYFVYRYNKKLSLKIKSHAVMAAAKDNLSDAWVSIGTVIAIVGSQFNLPWLDPLTALIVGGLIVKTAWEIFRVASHQLTDGFDEKLMEDYKDMADKVDGVSGVKTIRARSYGNNIVVDLVITVDANLDIHAAHEIATNVENSLIQSFEIYEVHVHVEPH